MTCQKQDCTSMSFNLPIKQKSLKFLTIIMTFLLVVAIHGLFLYLFFHQHSVLKQKTPNITPVEISVIQLQPKHLTTARNATKPPPLNKNLVSEKQPTARINPQAAALQVPPKQVATTLLSKEPVQQTKNLDDKNLNTKKSNTKKIEANVPSNHLRQITTPSQSKVETPLNNHTHPTVITRPVNEPISKEENKAQYKQNLVRKTSTETVVDDRQSVQPQPIINTTTHNNSKPLSPSNPTANSQVANIPADTAVNIKQEKSQTSQQAINVPPRPTQPIIFGNADASWKTVPNTQLPPNLSRLVKLKQLSSLTVKLAVNAEGNVVSCNIMQSSGDGEIDDVICQRLQKAKLNPKIRNGVNVASIGNLTIALK